jgi:hypothetical protein
MTQQATDPLAIAKNTARYQRKRKQLGRIIRPMFISSASSLEEVRQAVEAEAPGFTAVTVEGNRIAVVEATERPTEPVPTEPEGPAE